MQKTDIAIVGGGIVGLATAYQITQRYPQLRVAVLEKENDIALHQTGRNSGVLHSGIYYKPGSLRAKNCREGIDSMVAFCRQENIPYDLCGKVIVAVEPTEIPLLEDIYRRGQQNGVKCEMIGAERLREIEPFAAGIQAIHVPEAGIVNYRQVCLRLRDKIRERDGEVIVNYRVTSIRENSDKVIIQSEDRELEASYVIACAGLYSDRLAANSGMPPGVQILPFRGEYFTLSEEAAKMCNGLIYPVPDPAFPFLGVHFTLMISGGVECGPNAVLAYAREGYTHNIVHWGELAEILKYRGFRRLAGRHWRQGLKELHRSYSKKAFLKALQRLIPAIQSHHLSPAPAGVRAMAVDPDGNLVDDFLIKESERVIHVCNAPSPAATASLAIGKQIVEMMGHRSSLLS